MKSPVTRSLSWALLLVAALAAAVGCNDRPIDSRMVEPPKAPTPAAPKLDTEYQAVVLTSGQVLIGKLEGLDTPHPVLRDVFAVRTVPEDPKNPQKTTNVLVSRAKEWHSPGYTVLSAHNILAVEPVSRGSRLEQLLAEEKKNQALPQ